MDTEIDWIPADETETQAQVSLAFSLGWVVPLCTGCWYCTSFDNRKEKTEAVHTYGHMYKYSMICMIASTLDHDSWTDNMTTL